MTITKKIPFIFKSSLLIFLSTLSYNAYAEYYIVSNGCGGGCAERVVVRSYPSYQCSSGCYRTYQCSDCLPGGATIVEMRSSSPYRYGDISGGTLDYEWVDP